MILNHRIFLTPRTDPQMMCPRNLSKSRPNHEPDLVVGAMPHPYIGAGASSAEERAASLGRTLNDVVSDGLRLLLAERPGPHREIMLPAFGGSGLLPGAVLEDKDALAPLLKGNDRRCC